MISGAESMLADVDSELRKMFYQVTDPACAYTWYDLGFCFLIIRSIMAFSRELRPTESFHLLDYGEGGVEEAAQSLRICDYSLCFLLLSFPMGSRRIKYKNILITYMNDRSSELDKRLCLLRTRFAQLFFVSYRIVFS